MEWFSRLGNIKTPMVVAAVLIAVASLLVSNMLITDLQREEENKVEVWAEAMRSLNAADENTDLNLVLAVINSNNTIPVIVTDSVGNPSMWRNLGKKFAANEDSVTYIYNKARQFAANGHVIRMDIPQDNGAEEHIDICYDESLLLRRLAVYPFIQLFVVAIFVAIAVFGLISAMKSEQNKVWVGLSKETAHQLGTPISSLMAWCEVLKEMYPNDEMLPEMEKDVKRLERIAERFSKVGSVPDALPTDLVAVLGNVVVYMERRFGKNVKFTTAYPSQPVVINLIPSLFEWVVENLCKNAIDAMDGHGSITVTVTDGDSFVYVDVADTGKGIERSKFKTVFKPGFTTKKRGWGLGLSLTRRIVEDYHKGKIFVKESHLGIGTTFRIELSKDSAK